MNAITEQQGRGWVTPVVMSPRGTPCNHHWRIDPHWGEVLTDLVTPQSATHFIVVVPGFETDIIVGEPA